MEESILIVGVHTRPAVFSAKRAGFEVYSVDYFGSIDTRCMADVTRSILQQKPFTSLGRLSENCSGEKLATLAEDLDADYTILTSTLTPRKKNILGNSPEKMRKIKDKSYQMKKVERLGFAIPESEVVESSEEAIEVAKNFGSPVILKPLRGAGGRGIVLIKDPDKIPEITRVTLVQRYIKGKAISISTLSTKDQSVALSTSAQILGSRLLNQKNFVYCGNIVPYLSPKPDEIKEISEMAEEISRGFGVVGWNGIDLVLSEEPVFMELNPRFQGTFDCVETSYGINLIDAHIKACEGELIEAPAPKKTSIRMTLFAGARSIVTEDLKNISYDVPCKNAIVEEGEPITTVVESSGVRRDAIMDAVGKTRTIYRDFVSMYSG